jgi:uncharacterized surface protein with fasciclin (FAS1) repeats
MATILDIVTGSDDFDLLELAVITAGLTDDVNALAGVTVFAPNDAAFTQGLFKNSDIGPIVVS